MIRRALVIVGAGPAGMSAAIAAAEAGIQATVIDESLKPGGQIYRQPNGPAAPARGTPRPGEPLLSEFERRADRIELLSGAAAWGVFPNRQVAVSQGNDWQLIQADGLVLAPGAYEYVPPFPGWTLPGVMTPGAAQALVKSQQILPGRRVLVAGSGPFLLVVADQLHRSGMEVAGVVEAAHPRRVAGSLMGLCSRPDLIRQGWQLYRRLRRAGVPFHFGHVVVSATGNDELREVTLAPCDRSWQPDRTQARTVSVDTLCVGYGFVPRTQLAQLAGCRLRHEAARGGWVPETDENLETSVTGVWAAGDGGGVGGALAAECQGKLAGLAAAHRLGALDRGAFDQRRNPVLRQLARLKRFAAALDQAFGIQPGLACLATPETIVCRCEELTLADVSSGLSAGGTNLRTLKVMTRLGMGPCQGNMCWPAMARWLQTQTGDSLAAIGPASPRPPIQPVGLGTLAKEPGLLGPAGANGAHAGRNGDHACRRVST